MGSKAFFELPAEEKKKLDKRVVGGPANKGYEVIGTQSLEEAAGADLKEVCCVLFLEGTGREGEC